MREYADTVQALRCCAGDDTTCDDCPRATGQCVDSIQGLLTDAANAIEELLAAVPKWHPVSESPKKRGDYWCNIRRLMFPDSFYQEKMRFDGECFVNVDGIVIERVTHWMPLPAPPKEEE